MEAQLEQIRDQQKESWNKSSPGWKRWDEVTMDFLRPIGDEIIHLLSHMETTLFLMLPPNRGAGAYYCRMIPDGKVISTDWPKECLKLRVKMLQSGD